MALRPKPIELGDDENVSGLQLVHEADETAPLSGGDAARDRFGDDAARLDREACGFDFAYLVFGRLPGR